MHVLLDKKHFKERETGGEGREREGRGREGRGGERKGGEERRARCAFNPVEAGITL